MTEYLLLAEKITIPSSTKALLWDMDGVLIDSLGLDLVVVNELLQKCVRKEISLEREFIQSIFAYDVPTFWKMILEKVREEYGVSDTKKYSELLISEYEKLRQNTKFELNPGIPEILAAAKQQNIRQAVVSNNPIADVREILQRLEIDEQFDLILGNDLNDAEKTLAKKPAPDFYLFAAQKLEIAPQDCVVIEDSLIGIEAGKRAGAFTIGVATGGTTRAEMTAAEFPPDLIYDSFA